MTNKSAEEESTTLRSEEQNRSVTTAPSSSISNTGAKNIRTGDLVTQGGQEEAETAAGAQQEQIHQPLDPLEAKAEAIAEQHARAVPLSHRASLTSVKSNIAGERGLAKSFKNALVRFSINFSLFLTKLKFIADDILSSDEIEHQIFYPTDSSSVLSELYEDNDDDLMPSYDIMKDNTFSYPTGDIRNIDIEAKAREMRKDNEPFVDGDKLWHLQNQQWLVPSEELSSMNGRLKLEKKLAEQELKHLVSTKDYSIVYNHLILKNKSLKKPMNLKDLLKVINAGWTVHKTWERAAQGLA